MKKTLTTIMLTALLFVPLLSHAEETPNSSNKQTLYVDDKLWITVRTEPRGNAEKIAVIQTGISMTLLSHKEGDDYAKVRTDNNHTGWVLYRYLTPVPVAKLRLLQVEKKLERLQGKNKQLKETLKALKGKKRDLDKHAKELEKNNATLDKDLNAINAISADAVQTYQQKKALQQKLQQQKTRLAKLDEDNGALKARLTLFTIIAAIIGLLIGLFIGTIPMRRNSRWRSMP